MLKRLFMMNILAFVVFIITATGCSMSRDMQEFDDEDELLYGEPLPADTAPAKKGWSVNGTLAQGVSKKRVALQAKFGKIGTYTVQFGVVLPTTEALAPCPTRIKATIVWSVEGNTVTRQVTVGNGLQISGTGEAVSVLVEDNTLANNNGSPDADIEYVVSVLITPGTRPSKEMPPVLLSEETDAASQLAGFTHGTIEIAPAGNFEFDIPENAGVIAFYLGIYTPSEAVAAADAILGRFLHTGGGIVGQFDATPGRGYAGTWIPLTPGANQIQIFNNTALNVVVTMIYGIDG